MDRKIVIGATLASQESSYLKEVSRYMRETAEKLDAHLILESADWDVQTQTGQLEEFIRQKVDAIILCPVNSKSMLVPLQQVEAAGIPVINLNMRVDAVSSLYIDTYVGASNPEEASLAAELVKKALGEAGGQIAIIEGAPGSDSQIYRTQTFVEQLTANQEIEIVGIGNGEWDRDKAKLTAWDLIQKNPDLKLIYCHDSNMAMGAIEAARKLHKEIQVIGISEMEEYIKAVRDGQLYGFITQPPDYEGITSVEKAVDAAKGMTLQPWYKDPIQIVTSDNIDSFEKMNMKN